MGVLPELQRQNIGFGLLKTGLAECQQAGHACVGVLVHVEYYPRFGFVPASRCGVGCEYDVPADVFMALELREGTF